MRWMLVFLAACSTTIDATKLQERMGAHGAIVSLAKTQPPNAPPAKQTVGYVITDSVTSSGRVTARAFTSPSESHDDCKGRSLCATFSNWSVEGTAELAGTNAWAVMAEGADK